MKDENRRGVTIKPFNDRESWDLLVQLLGDKWTQAVKSGRLKHSDMSAAKSWVEKLGGLRKSLTAAIVPNSNTPSSSFDTNSRESNPES